MFLICWYLLPPLLCCPCKHRAIVIRTWHRCVPLISFASSDLTEMDGCAWWNTCLLLCPHSAALLLLRLLLLHLILNSPFLIYSSLPLDLAKTIRAGLYAGKCDAGLLLTRNVKVQPRRFTSVKFRILPQSNKTEATTSFVLVSRSISIVYIWNSSNSVKPVRPPPIHHIFKTNYFIGDSLWLNNQQCVSYTKQNIFFKNRKEKRSNVAACLQISDEQTLYSEAALCREAEQRESGQWIIVVGWKAHGRVR